MAVKRPANGRVEVLWLQHRDSDSGDNKTCRVWNPGNIRSFFCTLVLGFCVRSLILLLESRSTWVSVNEKTFWSNYLKIQMTTLSVQSGPGKNWIFGGCLKITIPVSPPPNRKVWGGGRCSEIPSGRCGSRGSNAGTGTTESGDAEELLTGSQSGKDAEGLRRGRENRDGVGGMLWGVMVAWRLLSRRR